MLAVFSYQTRQAVSFRIDLLDFSPENAPSLLLFLDTFPGSIISSPDQLGLEDRWEMVITISPDHIVSLVSEIDKNLFSEQIAAAYDPQLDTIRLDLPLEAVQPPGPFEIAVVSIDPSTGDFMDTIGPVRSDTPPPEPIPMLLTFWNVFPSTTPAQALRSWDGAHNGPAGERFGLHHLLDAVEAYELPVVLADLKQPSSLAGLQLLGAVPMLAKLEQQALLSLPDVLPQPFCRQAARLGWPDWILNRLDLEAQRLDFQSSMALTCTPGVYNDGIVPISRGYRSLLVHASEGIHERISEGAIPAAGEIILLTTGASAQSLSFDGGLSLDLRQQLAANLDREQADSVFLLSVDFQRSFWGDPHSVEDSFYWIAEHPWIQPITLNELNRSYFGEVILGTAETEILDLPNNADQPSSNITLEEVKTLLNPPSSEALSAFTWQLLYEAYSTPICQTQRATMGSEAVGASLCENIQELYRSRLQLLSIVSSWEQMLARNASDDELRSFKDSLNYDSTMVIFLNYRWFAAVDVARSNLVALFAAHPKKGAIPLIWDPALQVPETANMRELKIDIKDFSAGDTLRVEFQAGASSGQLQLPIYLSPQHLYREQACLSAELETSVLHLGCLDDFRWRLEIDGGSWSLDTVLDSPARWNLVEDPDQEMPAGHFLPIPYGLLSVDFNDSLSLNMSFSE